MPLARYTDPYGRTRELVARPGHAGSVLVLDRDAITRGDRCLLAHLAPDEPRANAELVCRRYLEEDPCRRRCRPVVSEDFERTPFVDGSPKVGQPEWHGWGPPVADRHGNLYRLGLLPGERIGRQLRWTWRPNGTRRRRCIGLRDVVARLESYEPMRTLTERALERHATQDRCADISVARLEGELERLECSPLVLNRRLRETVQRSVRTRRTTMSEIAQRCGRVKCDRRGRLSGETSWLARRVGLMGEGGGPGATPWIHSDLLGLIAREGLALSPREVEL